MVYEKRLGNLSELAEELRTLDFDAGVRVRGDHEGRPCFMFVTKAGENFMTALYTTKKGESGQEVPDKRVVLREYKEVDPLLEFLKAGALTPLEAYSY